MQYLYKKIDFIHRQCIRFIAKREEGMADKLPSPIAIAMDKQDYVVKWTDSHSKKNVQLTGVTSIEAASGDVLGSSVNYDPTISTSEVVERAGEVGDLNTDSCSILYTQRCRARHEQRSLNIRQTTSRFTCNPSLKRFPVA